MALEYVLREMLPTDEGFIARSWVDTARAGTRQTRQIDASLFNAWHYPAVGALLKSPGVTVRVAGADDGLTIYGFAVYESGCVHCVYVRKTLRRLGLARALLTGVKLEGLAFSCWSRDVSDWVLERYPGLRYLPLWLSQRNSNGATDGRAPEASLQVAG